jgi:hypothetical protein
MAMCMCGAWDCEQCRGARAVRPDEDEDKFDHDPDGTGWQLLIDSCVVCGVGCVWIPAVDDILARKRVCSPECLAAIDGAGA